ncbi:hypothetical protein F5Y18DRAFT_54124 [Xylariaceae sp. FL1019]|nr:hypothetical protein F5Y18DRAFT_54124 [Xylariaceae sp. FL1019]
MSAQPIEPLSPSRQATARQKKLTLLRKAHEYHKCSGAQVYLMTLHRGQYTIYETKSSPNWPTKRKALKTYHPVPMIHTTQEFDGLPKKHWGISHARRRIEAARQRVKQAQKAAEGQDELGVSVSTDGCVNEGNNSDSQLSPVS